MDEVTGELGQCDSRVPALGVLARCAETALYEFDVTCPNGHDHTTVTCERHQYRDEQVGCLICMLDGRGDVPLLIRPKP